MLNAQSYDPASDRPTSGSEPSHPNSKNDPSSAPSRSDVSNANPVSSQRVIVLGSRRHPRGYELRVAAPAHRGCD